MVAAISCKVVRSGEDETSMSYSCKASAMHIITMTSQHCMHSRLRRTAIRFAIFFLIKKIPCRIANFYLIRHQRQRKDLAALHSRAQHRPAQQHSTALQSITHCSAPKYSKLSPGQQQS